MYRFHFILSVYVSSNHANICQKGLHLQVTVNPEIGGRLNCRMLLRGIYEKRQGKIGEKQKMKKGSGSSALSRSEFLLRRLSSTGCAKNCPLFEFPSFAAAWQSEQPVHSQSAKMKNVLPEFTQIGSLSFAQPCSSMKWKPL